LKVTRYERFLLEAAAAVASAVAAD
jgi:hypothetical protein